MLYHNSIHSLSDWKPMPRKVSRSRRAGSLERFCAWARTQAKKQNAFFKAGRSINPPHQTVQQPAQSHIFTQVTHASMPLVSSLSEMAVDWCSARLCISGSPPFVFCFTVVLIESTADGRCSGRGAGWGRCWSNARVEASLRHHPAGRATTVTPLRRRSIAFVLRVRPLFLVVVCV